MAVTHIRNLKHKLRVKALGKDQLTLYLDCCLVKSLKFLVSIYMQPSQNSFKPIVFEKQSCFMLTVTGSITDSKKFPSTET